MAYARFDDRYDDHKKIKRALRREPAAIAMHAMAITYCNRHNTDGDVDVDWVDEKLALMPYKPAQRQRVVAVLVDTGLFEVKDEETYIVHDFLDWNLSSEQRKILSEQGRRGGRGKSGRLTPTGSQGSSLGLSEGLSEGLSPSGATGLSTPTPTPTPSTDDAKASSNIRSTVARTELEKATGDDKRLCRLFADNATAHNPKIKVGGEPWLKAMRLLRDADDNSPDEIERVIRWLYDDPAGSFWANTVQSPSGLREHFAQIWAQMTNPQTSNVHQLSRRESPSDLLRAINDMDGAA